MNKNRIINNFSRYASVYDKYANIQQTAANMLIKDLLSERKSARYILEIGCGTGNYTSLLRQKFNKSVIKAIDISEKMVEVAKKKLNRREIDFIVADAETINLSNKFDIITSNATFQWFDNIEAAIEKYKNVLNKKGIISFSIFGPLTFWELDKAIKETLNEDIKINSKKFLEKNEISSILKKYFEKVNIKEIIMEEKYASLSDFLNKIKYTGTRGNGINGGLKLTRAILNEMEQNYKSMFGQIAASYQIFFCNGVK